MPFADWLIVLAIALMVIAFFCRRRRSCRSLSERARRLRGMRLLAQATVALWAALLIVHRGLTAPASVPFGLGQSLPLAFGAALMLTVSGCLWSFRGRRLLRQRRMFGTW
jgi:hypothetical protein